MGGPHVTELADEALGRDGGPRHADAVALGEADETWPQIVTDAERGQLKEIYTPVDAIGQEQTSLKQYPVIPWQSIDLDQFNLVPHAAKAMLQKVGEGWGTFRIIPVESGRGCPYGCEFCTVTGFFGDSIRFRTNESVVNELLLLKARARKEKGQMAVFFIDDNFAINVKRTKSLLRDIIAAGAQVHWVAQISANLLRDEELVDKFPSHQGDGEDAYQGVILDASGNVYGATEGGGTGKQGCISTGCGIDYELHHTPDGKWKEIVLHDFGTGGDDMMTSGGLILDAAGNLYGAAGGGAYNQGVVYRLKRESGGHWKAAIQYTFIGGADGGGPGDLVMDKSGNLFGATVNGGDAHCGCGVVFKLAPGPKGKWKYSVLHRFTGYDGAQPYAALILDSKGNLYGTTATGGSGGAGVAFEITP